MDRKLVKNFLIPNKYETSQIEGYIYPRTVGRSNLVSHRQKRLGDMSGYEKAFASDLASFTQKLKEPERKSMHGYIREFPILIEDRELWTNILTELGEPEDTDSWDRKYFLLDFLFPWSAYVVEIDSIFHKDKEVYDKARDLYCRYYYGLKVSRFYNYGAVKREERDAFQGIARKEVKTRYQERKNKGLGCINIDFTEYIVDSWLIRNKESVQFVDSLVNKVGGERSLWKHEEIGLTMREIEKCRPSIFKSSNVDSSFKTSFLSKGADILKNVYGIKLIIRKDG